MTGMNQLPNIDKIFRDDDDLDFVPSVGSNLAAIFGTPHKTPDSHSSLQYSSPKQPVSDHGTQQTTPASKTGVIVAKPVHAFKLQNGHYVSIGKLGMALIGNVSTRLFHIILYRGKQNHVSVVTITPDFSYTVQANNYSTYYDTNKENWSILFENEETCIMFAREIVLCKYFSKQTKIEGTVIYQDLTVPGKDVIAKEGDKIFIKYLIATEIIQPLKINFILTQTMVVEISTDDNWERLLLGTSKGLRRIMILPPNKQISLGPGFPKDKDIALEIEVTLVSSVENQSQPALKTAMPSGKASILSRMAKMGQSILPSMPMSTTTDSEDTEDELPHKSPRHRKKNQLHVIQRSSESQLVNKDAKSRDVRSPISVSQKPLVPVSTFASQWSQNQIQPQYVMVDGQLHAVQQQAMPQPLSAMVDPNLNMFLSESRVQNAEIRMGMSKIADNVQKLLDKFHVLEVQNVSTPTTDKTMETTLKLLIGMSTACQNNRESINNELHKHTATSEDEVNENSSIINRESDKKVTALEDELKQMKELLVDKIKLIGSIEEERRNLAQSNLDLNNRIEQLETSMTTKTSDMLEKTLTDLQTAKDLANNYQKQNVALENKISVLTTKCDTLENALSTLKQKGNITADEKVREIKRIMNETYQSLQVQFTDESYSTNFIKETVATTIRNVTLRILKEGRHVESQARRGILDKEKNLLADSVSSLDASRENNGENAVRSSQSSETPVIPATNTISNVQAEPPPVPPMDLDVDD